MKDFNYWKNLFDKQELEEFSNESTGFLWLKIKSILRKELIAEFLKINPSIQIEETTLAKQFIKLFALLSKNIAHSDAILDDFIKIENQKQVNALNTKVIISELYQLKVFEWGGDYQNSLDKFLVNKFVKSISSYQQINEKLKSEISKAVQGYVLNSWYNHWSSILIEHIFKSHNSVLPTVGQVKSVDFFINNIPFDLKVTYLPNEYVKQKRKEKGLPVELTFLKQEAKKADIDFNTKAKPQEIYHEIVEKMKDKNDIFCSTILQKLKNEKIEILKEAQQSPKILAKWLYENQGEMRFGSENRLFLVLVDTDDFDNSWKLKRNFALLQPEINNYLNQFSSKNTNDLKLSFQFKGKTYSTLADILFIVK